MHPLDGRANRRQFLRRSGGAALALSGASSILSACSNSTEPVGGAPYPLARPDRPVTLPLWEPPIPSGLEPETGGTFTVFNYPEYIYGKLLQDFGKKYDVKVEVTPFNDINSGIAILASGSVAPDVTEMTPDNLNRVVAAKLVKPINHSYVPNLSNVWDSLQSPFYDQGSHYTVPYTAYATGIAYRTDKVTEDIPAMSNPWDIFWEAEKYTGKTALLSEPRETIAMALLRKHHYDINTEDPKLINAALNDLQELYNICSIKVGDQQYSNIPEGLAYLNQAWSGDMMAAYLYYLPKGTPASVLGFWRPERGKGPVQNDCWSICSTTKKPVLAHLWLDYMCDYNNAYSNFVNFNGYQPPMKDLKPADLVKNKVIPESLGTCVLTENDFGPNSLQEMTLSWRGQQLWQNAYAYFQAG